jgi:hypothetical protein
VVYGCEGDLHSDLMAEILEHVTVDVLGIINCDLLWDAIMTDNVLLEEFFDSSRGYVGDRLRLNPFHEILNYHNGEGIIAMRWGELADCVNAPPL